MLKVIALLAASVAGVQLMSAHVDTTQASPDYAQQIDAWRTQRVERLKAPDGWLSLIGLHWLKDGKNTVGSAKDNDVVLAKGPAHLGTVTLKGGTATIDLDAKAGATIDGKPAESATLLDDSHDKPTTIAFGTASFYLVDRNGKKGLRVKDSERCGCTHPLHPHRQFQDRSILAHRGKVGRIRSTAYAGNAQRARSDRQVPGAWQGRIYARRQDL